jgi:hypothetical protein
MSSEDEELDYEGTETEDEWEDFRASLFLPQWSTDGEDYLAT